MMVKATTVLGTTKNLCRTFHFTVQAQSYSEQTPKDPATAKNVTDLDQHGRPVQDLMEFLQNIQPVETGEPCPMEDWI